MKKALVPLDLSKISRELVPYAFSFAERHGLERLEFIHVMTRADIHVAGYVGRSDRIDRERTHQELSEMIAWGQEKSGISSIPYDLVLCDGVPYDEIIKLAQQADYDIILIGHRGMSDIKRFFIGSVALKVVAAAPCKVLIYQ